MLTLKNVRKIYGTVRVLEKVAFSIGEGQKVALVGQNGAGKSTLLKIIAGIETPDRGTIQKPNRVLTGYLSQETLADSEETLLTYLRRMAGLYDLEKEMSLLEPHIAEPIFLEKYEMLRQEYERLGGYNFPYKAKMILEGLMLSHIDNNRPLSELSGGEKRKAALAGVLLRGVDMLLLDEPTNNLDLPSLLWLEKYLNRSSTTCIIASHDRRFLDNVVQKIMEIDWYKRDVTMYTGNWSSFAEMKAHSIRKHKEQYRMQEEERERLIISVDQKMDWVERVKNKKAPDKDTMSANFKKERATRKFTASAKALEERQKRLHTVEKPLIRDPLMMSFESPAVEKEGAIVLRKVCFGYPDGFSGGPIDMKIPFGTRLALLGNNGVGKSTLLRVIEGSLAPISGKRICGKKLIFGFLMQEYENISKSSTPYELFRDRLDIRERDVIATHLASFQFAPDVLNDKIDALSPGERVRLILALLSAMRANVLVLDEPTNHLDLEAIEALEEALDTYPGTLLLVTHDRRFLERVRLTQTFVLENGLLTSIADYESYVAKTLPHIERLLKRLDERMIV
ncbi:MAG: ABC-F family ATP-binding cassette domain-containing protein [Candidatus Moranbacteria bacterium]|nr:ABC-F family ATP-binding cassette domain-containing protein [Candidatus Moranbacteria bacterium]MDD3965066.1 ABC-F family ATP-binding cassette domain-containing protein [Candidatus Moranbacteria bacterium]